MLALLQRALGFDPVGDIIDQREVPGDRPVGAKIRDILGAYEASSPVFVRNLSFKLGPLPRQRRFHVRTNPLIRDGAE